MAFDLEAIWSGIGYQDSGKLAELFPSAGLEARFVEIEQNVGEANDQAASLAPGFQNLAERDEELLFGGGFFLPSLFSFEPGLFSLSARQFFIGFCSVSIGLGLALIFEMGLSSIRGGAMLSGAWSTASGGLATRVRSF